jgi:hypothetical protein
MLDHFVSGISCDQTCKWGIEWDSYAPGLSCCFASERNFHSAGPSALLSVHVQDLNLAKGSNKRPPRRALAPSYKNKQRSVVSVVAYDSLPHIARFHASKAPLFRETGFR